MNIKKFSALTLGVTVVIVAAIVLWANHTPKTNQSASQSPAASSSKTSGTSLDYSNRGLSKFPKEILNNRSAVSLNLSHNNLTGALPAEIKNLANLQTLDVSYNNMTGIPAEIGQMKNLKVLNYSYNQITGLPLEMGNLTQLQLLDLSGNPNVSQHDLRLIKPKLPDTQIKL